MDEVIINKIEVIQNCLKRIKEEYSSKDDFFLNYTKQDSVILNLQRACQAAIDLGTYMVRLKKLGVPQKTRDVFEMLYQAKILSKELSGNIQKMVGFRNISVHDYQKINLEIICSILERHLKDFQELIKAIKQAL